MPHLETKAERLEYLKRLRAMTNNACIIYEQRGGTSLLRCTYAEYRLDDEGHEHFAVSVQEASPDDGELQKFVHEQLSEAGFPNIQVETEW